MKEITRIITMQIKEVIKVPDAKMAGNKDAYAKTLAEDMRNDYSFEAVEVLSVQESIIDKK